MPRSRSEPAGLNGLQVLGRRSADALVYRQMLSVGPPVIFFEVTATNVELGPSFEELGIGLWRRT